MTTEGIGTKDLNVDTVNGVVIAMRLLSSQVARCCPRLARKSSFEP